MTKYVISGYIGFNNFGDEAIVGTLISHLKSINANKITVLSSNPKQTSNNHNVASEYYLNFYKTILETDVLISGGGSLLQDVTSLKSLIYYLAVIVTALVFNKKVIIFAQGFSPFRTFWGRFFTKFVLKYCDVITVRDIQSHDILKSMNINSEIIADPVFGIEVPKIEKQEGIGVQLRNSELLTESFMENLAEELSQRFVGQKVKLFSLQDSLDLDILKKFAKTLDKKNIKSEIYSNLDIKTCIYELSKLEYLIGMRFHANLIASKAKVKVLGINYDIKVENLSKQIGFPIVNFNNNPSCS